ncbi:MAG TPA: DUF4339 domain-containing protein, partial [Pirellulaceae bacterium]|nr:DUF4339 domain-containing protein [Pirellulaceae bacterium]
MGIKFRCPNGHKLNVKSFLAGKRGVCPKCGTSVRIPEQSQETAKEEPGEEAEDRVDLLDEARFPAPGRAAAAANGNAAVAARPAAPVAISVTPRPLAAAIPVAIPVAASPASDPIAESPAAIWYVRPPGGDQYGPARGDIMRRWIAEGRVSGDSLVWREGWTDWREAREVFTSLPSALPQPPPTPGAAAPAAKEETPPAVPRSTRLTNRYEGRKKSGSGMGIAVIVFLGLLCVVLGILLVYFFFNNGITSPAPAS